MFCLRRLKILFRLPTGDNSGLALLVLVAAGPHFFVLTNQLPVQLGDRLLEVRGMTEQSFEFLESIFRVREFLIGLVQVSLVFGQAATVLEGGLFAGLSLAA